MRLEEEELWWRIVTNALATPAPLASAGPVRKPRTQCRIGIERIPGGVREHHVRAELPDQVGELADGLRVHDEWIVATIEGSKIRAEHRSGRLGLTVADLLTRSSVWPSSFQSSPDSPRSP